MQIFDKSISANLGASFSEEDLNKADYILLF